jgi:hypothetical protein
MRRDSVRVLPKKVNWRRLMGLASRRTQLGAGQWARLRLQSLRGLTRRGQTTDAMWELPPRREGSCGALRRRGEGWARGFYGGLHTLHIAAVERRHQRGLSSWLNELAQWQGGERVLWCEESARMTRLGATIRAQGPSSARQRQTGLTGSSTAVGRWLGEGAACEHE